MPKLTNNLIRGCWNKGLRTGVIVKCLNCERDIYQYPCKQRRFCSKKCMGSSKIFIKLQSILKTGLKTSEETRRKQSEANKGEKSSLYKHGLSKLWKKRYYNVEYKIWREKVFERDNYTCQNCNKNNCYITAHHIKSWAKYPLLRYEIDNGIVLCEPCHSLTDNYKGRGKL